MPDAVQWMYHFGTVHHIYVSLYALRQLRLQDSAYNAQNTSVGCNLSTEWLFVKDVANELKVNPERVRGWIRRKELLAYRIGGKEYRIKRGDLNAFLQGGRTFDDDQKDRD